MEFKTALLVAIGLAVATMAALSQRATLHIYADTPVVSDAALYQDMKQIGTLHAGTQIPVLSCEDGKVTLFYKIRLPDGRIGLVEIDDSFRREIRWFWSAPFSSTLVFGCI